MGDAEVENYTVLFSSGSIPALGIKLKIPTFFI
jgi:hypothetical protein